MKTLLSLLTAFAVIYGLNLAYERSFGPSPLSEKTNEIAVDAGSTADQLQSDVEKKAAEAKALSDKAHASADEIAREAQAAKDLVNGK